MVLRSCQVATIAPGLVGSGSVRFRLKAAFRAPSTSLEDLLFPYRYKVSLRFRHPSADLSHFTNLIGIEPGRQWTSGELRSSPRGTSLDGVRSDSYWCASIEVGESDFETSLLAVLIHLEQFRDAIELNSVTGGCAELFIGFFLEAFNGGFSLKPELLEKCASLHLSLDFDIYGQEDDPRSLP
ncbi:DUF4279 domain-containing protein [Lysobacter sp. GCM10012299]|uniref:DUF4279 domain-containing protein n=1 Tax=Lysobacter sp. GCM10012299 TaxID=3317333 RepID=UPI003608BDF5